MKKGETKDMNEKEMVNLLIDNYSNLQRIKNAPDKGREIEYQLNLIKAKLEFCGILVSQIDINEN